MYSKNAKGNAIRWHARRWPATAYSATNFGGTQISRNHLTCRFSKNRLLTSNSQNQDLRKEESCHFGTFTWHRRKLNRSSILGVKMTTMTMRMMTKVSQIVL